MDYDIFWYFEIFEQLLIDKLIIKGISPRLFCSEERTDHTILHLCEIGWSYYMLINELAPPSPSCLNLITTLAFKRALLSTANEFGTCVQNRAEHLGYTLPLPWASPVTPHRQATGLGTSQDQPYISPDYHTDFHHLRGKEKSLFSPLTSRHLS